MQTSSQPKLLPIPFADAGSKQDIPNDSQIGIVAGRASYNDGFPPLTRTPLAGGGVPPFGTDFNGVFNDITAAIRWSQAGAGYPFNAAFNTAVAGYPKGARIPNSTLDGFWLNTTDGNSTNPENTTAAITGWVPSGVYGSTAITGLSGSSVTLTSIQASKDRITLAGTLTANINLVFPAWIKRWEIINNCTGSFSVTVKTPAGTGVAVAAGSNANVSGDGVNINSSFAPGALIGSPKIITTSGTYTPSLGTKNIIVEMVSGGGASGGVPASSSSANFASGGGGGGGYAKFLVSSPVATSVTVGAGGVGTSGGTGATGGTTSFGSYASITGGSGSSYGQANGGPLIALGGSGGVAAVSASAQSILTINGTVGLPAIMINGGSGANHFGGSSVFGVGGIGSGNGAGGNGVGYGAGGGGSMRGTNNTGTAANGASGSGGVVIVWEYA